MKQIFALQTISNLNVTCQFIEIFTLNLIEILCGNVRKCVKSSHWIFFLFVIIFFCKLGTIRGEQNLIVYFHTILR